MRTELHKEQLTMLPKRLETRRMRGGGDTNIALVNQENTNVQLAAFNLFNFQNSEQANVSFIDQR